MAFMLMLFLRDFERGSLGEALDAPLGRSVGAFRRITGQAAGDRRLIDDRAAVVFQHLTNLMLHAVKNAAQIGIDGNRSSR